MFGKTFYHGFHRFHGWKNCRFLSVPFVPSVVAMSLIAACRVAPSFPYVKNYESFNPQSRKCREILFPSRSVEWAFPIRKSLISMIISDNFNAGLGP
jgi:hypothetical protein